MNLTLQPQKIGGSIAAIASKSQAHRLLICAALADKPTKIKCPQTSKDIEATACCLRAMGAKIEFQDDSYLVQPIQIPQKNAVLDCGESGSTLRFLLPVVAALGVGADFRMHGRLPDRPLSPMRELLESSGISLSKPSSNILHVDGCLPAGNYEIAGNVSSQFVSGLLFALSLTGESSNIMLTSPLQSAPYVDMTVDALERFGIVTEKRADGFYIPSGQTFRSCGNISVEGDWSNAAFWLCAGAICAPIEVTGLNPKSAQGDRKILELLENFGAKVEREESSVRILPRELRGIEIDANDIPDLVPPLALVAACANGTTRIFGAERLRLKESDRLLSVSEALNALGGKVTVTDDGLLIEGTSLRGGCVDSQNDHRIAMMTAIASTVSRDVVELRQAEAVEKSYPKFWSDFSDMKKKCGDAR